MVAIVTGTGLGLQRTSAWVLGSRGQIGDATFGRYGENVYVNGNNGNLVITRTDEILVGRGPDDVITRTYNSEGTSAYNEMGSAGDNWQLNAARRLLNYTGDANHNSGTIMLSDWDGSDETYSWNGSFSAYVNKKGAGSYDTLAWDSTNSEWIRTDGDTRLKDAYNDVNTNSGRIKRTEDLDGNKLTYTYTDGKLTKIETDNHQTTNLTWNGNGNLTKIETKASDGTTILTRVKSATVTWDGLNRMVSYDDNAVPEKTISIDWKYDRNSNIRNMATRYYALTETGGYGSTATDKSYWYLYDSMNRFVATKWYRDPTTHVISRGADGTDLKYDKIGRRIEAITTTAVDGQSGTYHEQKETYDYTYDGYLAKVSIAFGSNTTNQMSPPAASGTGPKRADYVRDAMGRVLTYSEYDTSGTNDVFKRVSTFNNNSQVTHDVVTTERTDGIWVSTTDYKFTAYDGASLGTYNGAYQGGVVTGALTSTTKQVGGGQPVDQPDTETSTLYTWWDGALQYTTYFRPDASHQSSYNTSSYTYDSDGHLNAVWIQDGHERFVNFVVDSFNQILVRLEANQNHTTNGPDERHYYFNGMQVGDVGTNGTSNTDYAASITAHTKVPGSGLYRGGSTTSIAFADFDQSYDALNGMTYENAAAQYTVHDGDTLMSIAYAVWGDSTLWYMIADANGLTGSETLTGGMVLSIPNKTHNIHNNSDTYRVYDPNEAIGDTAPKFPKPKKADDCGGFGQILVAVVAIVVTILLPEIFPIFEGFIGGMAAAAIGNAVGQGVGLLTGVQSKFNWGSVAMAAISAGVSYGVDKMIPATGFLADLAKGAISSAATQGIGMALGLQKRFDWASVASAGVSRAVGNLVSQNLSGAAIYDDAGQLIQRASTSNVFASSAAGAIAGAAAATLVNGRDFGDNLSQELPSVIGQTIGSAIANGITQARATAAAEERQRAIDEWAQTPEGAQQKAQIDQIVQQTFGHVLTPDGVISPAGATVATDFSTLGPLPYIPGDPVKAIQGYIKTAEGILQQLGGWSQQGWQYFQQQVAGKVLVEVTDYIAHGYKLSARQQNELSDLLRGPNARNLQGGEMQAARRAYGNSVDLSDVKIVKGFGYNPFAMMAFDNGNPAITVGNTIYLNPDVTRYGGTINFADLSTTITGVKNLDHELTHVYQFQRVGIDLFTPKWIAEAIYYGADGAYDYRSRASTFRTETYEGQAAIVGDYAGLLKNATPAYPTQRQDLEARLKGTGIFGL